MELLILSQLKWDITAITAYDYLDHLLDALDVDNGPIPSDFEELRRHTERFITLCATEDIFLSLPPSMIASAALASAVRSTNNSTNLITSTIDRLQNLTNIEMVNINIYLFISNSKNSHFPIFIF